MNEMKAVGLQHKVTNTKTCKKLTPDSEKIRIVRRITKAESDSDAVDKALDIVIANSRIEKTLKSVKGKGNIKDIYGRLGSPSQAINRPAISSSRLKPANFKSARFSGLQLIALKFISGRKRQKICHEKPNSE